MIADAMDGNIDYIITKSISRFARNTLDCLTYVRQLKEKGIGVFFEKENIDTLDSKGEVLLTILSSLAQDEVRNISENVAWGHRKRFADGKIMMAYANFLGYKKGDDGIPEIVPKEAEAVKLIYKLFLEGKTPNNIAKILMEQDIKAPSGGDKWYAGTVQSILQNEKYMGDALLQKTYVCDFLTKKVVVNSGELPQYYIENSHPGIVSKEVFQMVQQEFKRRETNKRQYNSASDFSGKIICGECGSFYGSKVWHSNSKYCRTIWRCNRKYSTKGKKACNLPHFDEEIIKKAFVDMFNSIFENKGDVIETLETTINDTLNDDKIDKKLQSLQLEKENIETAIRSLINKNATTKMYQDIYIKKYTSLAENYEILQKQIEQLKNMQLDTLTRREHSIGFINTMKAQGKMLAEFDCGLWNCIIENVTVVSENMLKFRLKDGFEIDWII